MTNSNPPTNPPETGKPGRYVTFADAEERLVEAMGNWWRMPDREKAWQHVRSLWPDILRHGWRVGVDGEHDEREAVTEPKRPPLTRDQVAEMIEASEWIVHAPERDRRLVAMVLVLKARGVKRISWVKIWDRLGRGAPGPEGLRSRYSRAVGDIARALSR